MSWLSQLRALGVVQVARKLGLQVYDGGRHLGPCPACHESARSRTDSRPGPLFSLQGQGWVCQRCNMEGGPVELAMLVVLEVESLPKGDERWKVLRQRCSEAELCGPWVRARDVQAPPPPPRRRIPQAELVKLWGQALPADRDREVRAWLAGRGIDPELAAARDLVRALPTGALPRWAHFKGAPWSHGWRALLRAWDHRGELVSIRARWVRPEPPPDGGEKTGAAAGGPGSAGGAVLACSLGRQVLQCGRRPDWWPEDVPMGVVVTEGEPDFLTWACRSEDELAPAVLGVFSGAWTDEVAARIPDGAIVASRVHHDEQGERYAKKIAQSLYYRCEVRRSRSAHGAA